MPQRLAIATPLLPETRWILPELLEELLRDGDQDLVGNLLSVFQTDTASRLQDASNSARHGDFTVLKAQAHSIKGSSLQMGAIVLAEILETIELAPRELPVPELLRLLAEAEGEFGVVCHAMKQFGAELAPAPHCTSGAG